jgi:hypothetical protein
MMVQQLNDRDMASRSKVAERLIRILSDDVINLKPGEAKFHLSDCFTIGQIHSSSINYFFTVHVWLFDVERQTSE